VTETYQEIIQRIESINPIGYQKTRNFLDGDVTRLSKYITRGVLPLPRIKDFILEKYSLKESYKFIQELAWREYFQRVWEAKGDDIFTDIRFKQESVESNGIPQSVINARTGIELIDNQIQELYKTGYLHNHSRMTIASLCCNLGRGQWLLPAKWMYYHLLDGDPASNMLSWQWVAGTSVSKKYFIDQELINYWSKTNQDKTFLSFARAETLSRPIPQCLQETVYIDLETPLIQSDKYDFSLDKDICIYHSFSLDPKWHAHEDVERILLLEPKWFSKMPISKKVLDAIVEMARQLIPNVIVRVESFEEFCSNFTSKRNMYVIEHPSIDSWTYQYLGKERKERLFPEVEGYYKSFSAYWKECKKFLDI